MTVVCITYRDPFMEFLEGEADEPMIHQVYGVECISRFPGYMAVRGEVANSGEARAVTHIPEACITDRQVFLPSNVATTRQRKE